MFSKLCKIFGATISFFGVAVLVSLTMWGLSVLGFDVAGDGKVHDWIGLGASCVVYAVFAGLVVDLILLLSDGISHRDHGHLHKGR